MINKEATQIITELWSRGFEAYLVGGCVRDMFLNKQPKDWDITTNAKPEEVMAIFKQLKYNVIPTGIRHGTVSVSRDNKEFFEITTYRVDGKYSDGRRPDSVSFNASIKDDLSRRDFTINAMAYNPITNEVLDYFGGRSDLNNRLIKCVGNPAERFKEDYLRLLRAIGFACQLDFDVDYEVLLTITASRKGIRTVSAERIRDEFFKMIISNPIKALDILGTTGIMKEFAPEFNFAYEFKQENPHHIYSLGEHTAIAMSSPYLERNIVLIIVMFLHDLGKMVPGIKTFDANGIAHFYGHSEESVKIARKILDRLKVSNEFKAKVLLLITKHEIQIQGKKAVRKILTEIGEENLRDLFKVQLADAQAQNPIYFEEKLSRIQQNIAYLNEILVENECFKLSDMKINGNDLIKIGFKPGKEMGAVIKYLFDSVVENPSINSKEQLENIAKTLLEKSIKERY